MATPAAIANPSLIRLPNEPFFLFGTISNFPSKLFSIPTGCSTSSDNLLM